MLNVPTSPPTPDEGQAPVRTAGKIAAVLGRIGADPSDGEERQLQKMLLVAGVCMFMFAGVAWGLLYIAAGAPRAGAIPLSYAVISMVSLGIFAATRSYPLLVYSQLTLILLLPFLLMISLGGFIASSGVILWSLLCPIGALLFKGPQQASRWFVAYVGLVVVSGFLQPQTASDGTLHPSLVIALFVLNISTVSLFVFVLLQHFVGATHLERERSNGLLLNILPPDIVRILKAEPRTIADHFVGASILFADIVEFTPLASSITPADLVELLNEVFSEFDALVDQYGLEKIKTIGDCYMVAAGVPRPRSDHAVALTRLALDMQQRVQSRTFRGRELRFRVGIDSGPVVAGIIGRKKFIYDLWGDAVNTASRMESHGASGQIQVTRATYELIRDQFDCVPRGRIAIKGKGEMEVWYVVRYRVTDPPRARRASGPS